MALTPFDLAPDPRFAAATQQAQNLSAQPAYQGMQRQVQEQNSGFNSALGGARTALLGHSMAPFLQQSALGGAQIGQNFAGMQLQGQRTNEAMQLQAADAERKRRQQLQDLALSSAVYDQDRGLAQQVAGQRSSYGMIGAALGAGFQAGGGIYRHLQSLPIAPPEVPDGVWNTVGAPPR